MHNTSTNHTTPATPAAPSTTPTHYTHPDVLGRGVFEGWADPITDPTEIDWAPRQARAEIPFEVVDGRPVNPCQKTGIERGRGELGHWGEALAADAVVSATDEDGCRWLVMVERADGHGWALPGGHVESWEDPAAAAVRELEEETGLRLREASWRTLLARYVPDPRASDEAWIVTVPSLLHLGMVRRADLPALAGADDARQAAWVPADTYPALVAWLEAARGRVFTAHADLLRDLLETTPDAGPVRDLPVTVSEPVRARLARLDEYGAADLIAETDAARAEVTRTDTKAGTLLAFTGTAFAVLAALVTLSSALAVSARVGLAAAVVLLAASSAVALSVIRPTLPRRGEGTGVMAHAELNDPQELLQALATDPEERRARDVIRLSQIARSKHGRLQRAVDLMLTALAVVVVSLPLGLL